MDSNKLFDLLSCAVGWYRTSPYAPQLISCNPEQLYGLLSIIHPDKDIENSLLEFVSNEPGLDTFNDRMLNTGGGSAHTVTFHTLVRWLVFIAFEEGAEIAVRKIENYITLDHNPAHEYLAISGVELDTPVDLSDSIKLIPFESIPSCIAKDFLDPPFLKPEVLLSLGVNSPNIYQQKPNTPKAALLKISPLTPKSFSQEDEHEYSGNSKELYEACEVLTLVGESTPVPLAHWFLTDESVPCVQLRGGSFSFPTHELVSNKRYSLNGENILYLKSIYEKFSKLNQHVKDLLRIPIIRLNQARRRQNIVDKAIDLGVSLESLFMNDKKHNEQISFTFRLRAAWYLGISNDDRTDLIEFFKNVYDCRSQAIHKGKLDDKIKRKGLPPISTVELLSQADDKCVKAICKVIDNTCFPNWDELILGKQNEIGV